MTGKHKFQSLLFDKVEGLQPKTLFEKETPTQVFPCEFYESFKNIFYRTPLGDCFRREICTWLHLFDCGYDDLIIQKQRIRKSTLLCFIARQSS